MGVFEQKMDEVGRPGEEFVIAHIAQLLPKDKVVLHAKPCTGEPVKGADVETFIAEFDQKAMDEFTKYVLEQLGIQADKAVFFKKAAEGCIEVKTLQWKPGTVRNDIDCGHILVGFEMWENMYNPQSSPGWLRAMVYPEQANEYAKAHPEYAHQAVQQLIHLFLLERPENEQAASKYHACIGFFDVPKLIERVIGLMPYQSWDLNNPGTIADTLEPDKIGVTHFKNGTFFKANMWWIPLNKLQDIAEITKIDNPVRISDSNRNRCSQAVERVESLYAAAAKDMSSAETSEIKEGVVAAIKAIFGPECT